MKFSERAGGVLWFDGDNERGNFVSEVDGVRNVDAVIFFEVFTTVGALFGDENIFGRGEGIGDAADDGFSESAAAEEADVEILH